MTRLIFMGTADLAAEVLRVLCQQPELKILAVVSQPDKPKGRDLKTAPTPVKTVALEHQLPVLQPPRARDPQFIEQLRVFAPDLIVVAAYGQILPQALLDIPRHGCLNVHTSLLPRHRGAAPIQWAIMEGDAATGVTIMKMDAGLDTGAMLSTVTTAIAEDDNAQKLHDRLALLGAELLVRTIPEFVAGKIIPQAQPAEGVTYARKISKEDGALDWSQPARSLWNRIRAFTPWPGAFTFLPGETRPMLVKIWRAEMDSTHSGQPGEILVADRQGVVVACGDHSLRVHELQREGGRRLGAQEFLSGHPLQPGQRFVASPPATA
jgi:methionyl-tRNA formyltransferase